MLLANVKLDSWIFCEILMGPHINLVFTEVYAGNIFLVIWKRTVVWVVWT